MACGKAGGRLNVCDVTGVEPMQKFGSEFTRKEQINMDVPGTLLVKSGRPKVQRHFPTLLLTAPLNMAKM